MMMMWTLARKNNKSEMIIIPFVLSILIGSGTSSECNLADLAKCAQTLSNLQSQLTESPYELVSEMIQSGPFSSPFETASELFKECQVQSNTIYCVKRLVESCLTDGQRQVFQVTTSGAQNFATELCNNASETHKKYMDSFDCIQNAAKGAALCKEKFALSLTFIREQLEDERSKSFYICCAFEWMKNCKVRIANELCGADTGSLINHMATMEVGEMLNKACGNNIGNCYGRLFGVDDSSGRLESSFTAYVLLVLILWVNHLYKD